MIDTTGWSCPMWQGYLTGIVDYEERKRIVETEVPEEFRERVITHCKTVLALKKRGKK